MRFGDSLAYTPIRCSPLTKRTIVNTDMSEVVRCTDERFSTRTENLNVGHARRRMVDEPRGVARARAIDRHLVVQTENVAPSQMLRELTAHERRAVNMDTG